MSVYVDGASNAYGRMVMCHMTADTEAELNAMADKIGVARRWMQRARCGLLHYDICKAKRKLAVAAGAIEIDRRQVVEIMRRVQCQSNPT